MFRLYLRSSRILVDKAYSLDRRQFSSPALNIINECHKLRESVQSLNDKIYGPLEKSSQKNTILPFVFLLGNHSSGKSSFINYLLQRKVQTAGVAPTDDSFTIVVPGVTDQDRDGPAFVGDPDMGFSALRSFGPTLIHHTQLKVRSNTAIKDFMLVDSPGMIDSPSAIATRSNSVTDRGYDFEGVAKWYANRADVVLLFFDPDKPGTTGETLSILTKALVGMEHKLHIILNKADQFRKIHDFARAYGSLCWNLSKVINRKDLPRIYTMCLPPDYRTRAAADRIEGPESVDAPLGQGLMDLQTSRDDVVKEVMNAPKRRIDNEITRLNDSLQLLEMHCRVLDHLVASYRGLIWRQRAVLAASTVLSATLGTSSVVLEMPVEVVGSTILVGLLANVGIWLGQRSSLRSEANRLIATASLDATYHRIYARQIAERDEFVASLWQRVREHMRMGMSDVDFRSLRRLNVNELAEVMRILEVEVPALRRKVAPLLNSLS